MEKINIPSGWHEVPVAMFAELSALDKGQDGFLKVIDVISILADIDSEDVKKFSAVDIENIVKRIGWTSSMPTEEFKTTVEIGDVKYHLVKLSSLSVGQCADLDFYSEDMFNNLHKVFAVLYRPVIEQKFNERVEIFEKQLMISDVYGALAFFLTIALACTMTSRLYSQA